MASSKTAQARKFFYREGSSDELGPFTGEELRIEVRAGRVTANSYVRRANEDRWLAALSMASLAADFDAAKEHKTAVPPQQKPAPASPKSSGPFGLPISNGLVGGILGLALLVAIIAAMIPAPLSKEQKRVIDGKSVYEWNQITKITLDEESGIAYELVLDALKRHAQRPATVELVGGHQVEALGCQLSGTRKHQPHVCSGKFRFKNLLGIEDETTYEVYLRKYDDGQITKEDVEIGGRIVEAGK